MATHYVDPAASGTNDGTSWTDAWTDFQSALDTAVAGDTVYMRGTQTLTAVLDVDTNNGSAGSWIKFIGCNAAGVADGTRFVLDGDNAVANCIRFAATFGAFTWWENIEGKNASSHGIQFLSNAGAIQQWENFVSRDNGGWGFYGYYCNNSSFTDTLRISRSQFINNTQGGLYRPFYGLELDSCVVKNNGGNGVETGDSGTLNVVSNCISHNNSGVGILVRGEGTVRNCVVDGNTTGIQVAKGCTVSCCRITNNTTGLVAASADYQTIYDHCVFYNNTTNITGNATPVKIDGVDTNVTSGATEGYTDRANDNFNLTSTATLRRQEVALDTANSAYIAAGLSPADTGNVVTVIRQLRRVM